MSLSRLRKKMRLYNFFAYAKYLTIFFFASARKRKNWCLCFSHTKKKKTSSVSFSASAKFSHFRIFSHAKKRLPNWRKNVAYAGFSTMNHFSHVRNFRHDVRKEIFSHMQKNKQQTTDESVAAHCTLVQGSICPCQTGADAPPWISHPGDPGAHPLQPSAYHSLASLGMSS